MAYKVQQQAVAALDAGIAGWKVTTLPDGQSVAAPLLAGSVWQSPAVCQGGSALETEIIFRLGKDLPPSGAAYQREDILAAIASIAAGFEVLGPRIAGNDASIEERLADNLMNFGVVVGDEQRFAPDMIEHRLDVSLRQDPDDVVFDADTTHPLGDPLLPLLSYANAQGDRLGGLRAGQIIITGSLTGVIGILPPASFSAGITGIGHVDAQFI